MSALTLQRRVVVELFCLTPADSARYSTLAVVKKAMNQTFLLALDFLYSIAQAAEPPWGPALVKPCDHACLTGVMDRYTDAVMRHNQASLPLAEDAKFTENTALVPMARAFCGAPKWSPHFSSIMLRTRSRGRWRWERCGPSRAGVGWLRFG